MLAGACIVERRTLLSDRPFLLRLGAAIFSSAVRPRSSHLVLLVVAVLAAPVIGLAVQRHAAGIEQDRARAHLDRTVATANLAIERPLPYRSTEGTLP